MTHPRGRRRRRRPSAAFLLAVLIALGAIMYGIALPAWRFHHRPPVASWFETPYDVLFEDIRMRLVEVFTVLWIFFFGACIGSFLNVVIYRCPRGETLFGHSHCPYCRHAIRARHNVPVFGWLMLRGRCYDCRLPISPRYPLVEAVIGGVFLLLASVELFSGGANLPLIHVHRFRGIVGGILDPQWELIATYGLHCGLLTILLSWVLIWYDRQVVPASYTSLAFGLVLLAALLRPEVHPVSFLGTAPVGVGLRGIVESLATTLLGAAVGAIAGFVQWLLVGTVAGTRASRMLALVGAVVGWQAVFTVGLLVPIALVLQRWVLGRAVPGLARSAGMAVWGATVLQLVFWRNLTAWPGLPGPGAPLVAYPIALVVSSVVIGETWRRMCGFRDDD